MKTKLIVLISFLTFLGLQAQVPKGIPSIEDPDFGSYFMGSSRIPVVKGRLLRYSLCNPDSIKITYSVVTPFASNLQLRNIADYKDDGSFELRLDYAFPYQQIWLSIGNLFYTGIYAHSDLFIELDAEKLLKQKTAFIGDGVKYLGSDGELNTFMNNHILFKRKNQELILSRLSNLRFGGSTSYEDFITGYDSLFKKLNDIDDEYISDNPSPHSWIIKNERLSQYYSIICVKHWGKEMDDYTWNKLKDHKSYIISNKGVYFYSSLFTYLRRIASKNVMTEEFIKSKKNFNDTNKYSDILNKLGPAETITVLRTIANIELLDSIFDPAKSDFLKMKIESRDVKEQKVILDLVLKSTRTEWCKKLLELEYKKTTQKLDSINAILNKSNPIKSSTADLGQMITEFSFGAKLYTVKNIKASDLLSNIKQSFKNEALLIDFWATWCSPCIQEMPFSKNLHNSTKDLPIEFIYLCTSNGSSIDKWKSKIAELQIPGIHLLVDETIETELMNLFSKSGFPSYVYLNSNGTYLPGAIVRPSMTDRNKIKELITKK